MTVKELINALAAFPPDMQTGFFSGDPCGTLYSAVTAVESESVLYANYGRHAGDEGWERPGESTPPDKLTQIVTIQ